MRWAVALHEFPTQRMRRRAAALPPPLAPATPPSYLRESIRLGPAAAPGGGGAM